MPKFAIHPIEEIRGRINIYKLEVDGLILYDAFERLIKREGTYIKELNNIQAILIRYAELRSLSDKKFKPLQGCRDTFTEYEIKTKNLWVYLFKEEKTGSIIVYGGKKNRQNRDISEFRRIKRAYLNSISKY